MKTIPREKIERYVSQNGDYCPHCGTPNVFYRSPMQYHLGAGTATSNCRCNSCGEEWTEEYQMKLTWITEEEPEAHND